MEKDYSNEFIFSASRSSGAGGQNVNKVSTKVELRFDVNASKLLTEEEKLRIFDKLYNKITLDGILVIVSQQERTQLKNKELCIEKFHKLLQKALTIEKERIPTKKSRKVKEKRLKLKKEKSELKKNRKRIDNSNNE